MHVRMDQCRRLCVGLPQKRQRMNYPPRRPIISLNSTSATPAVDLKPVAPAKPAVASKIWPSGRSPSHAAPPPPRRHHHSRLQNLRRRRKSGRPSRRPVQGGDPGGRGQAIKNVVRRPRVEARPLLHQYRQPRTARPRKPPPKSSRQNWVRPGAHAVTPGIQRLGRETRPAALLCPQPRRTCRGFAKANSGRFSSGRPAIFICADPLALCLVQAVEERRSAPVEIHYSVRRPPGPVDSAACL